MKAKRKSLQSPHNCEGREHIFFDVSKTKDTDLILVRIGVPTDTKFDSNIRRCYKKLGNPALTYRNVIRMCPDGKTTALFNEKQMCCRADTWGADTEAAKSLVAAQYNIEFKGEA
jgi:hypothetical protein